MAHGVEFESDRAAFLGYDEKHHRIGIIAFDNLALPTQLASRLERIAFTLDNLQDLVSAYEQCKAYGISPAICMNHGPTTSICSKDFDGNRLASTTGDPKRKKAICGFAKKLPLVCMGKPSPRLCGKDVILKGSRSVS